MTYLYTLLVLGLVIAGGDLLYHLGRGSVPDVLKPIAGVSVKSGIDSKRVNIILWMLFALIAGAFLFFVLAFIT